MSAQAVAKWTKKSWACPFSMRVYRQERPKHGGLSRQLFLKSDVKHLQLCWKVTDLLFCSCQVGASITALKQKKKVILDNWTEREHTNKKKTHTHTHTDDPAVKIVRCP
jgi:hypothetical protein